MSPHVNLMRAHREGFNGGMDNMDVGPQKSVMDNMDVGPQKPVCGLGCFLAMFLVIGGLIWLIA